MNALQNGKWKLGGGIEHLEDRELFAVVLGDWQSGTVFNPPDTQLTAELNSSGGLIIDGSDSRDVVNLSHNGNLLQVNMQKIENGQVVFQNTVSFNSAAVPYITVNGKGGNDLLVSSLNRGVMMFGNAGDDVLHGGSAGDNLYGDAGADTIYGNGGNDYIFGGTEIDSLFGGNDIDQMYGDAGHDNMYGGLGNDVMSGGLGNDAMFGDAGSDTMFGGEDHDQMIGDNWQLGTSGGGHDTMYGGNGEDTLIGNSGDDKLYGENHNDFLFGGIGQDRLYGNDGQDHLWGDAGNDYLDGGYISHGNFNVGDILEGGLGADTFVRHKSFFGIDDLDLFKDYNSGQNDNTENVWHW